jgi:hypothetical protein
VPYTSQGLQAAPGTHRGNSLAPFQHLHTNVTLSPCAGFELSLGVTVQSLRVPSKLPPDTRGESEILRYFLGYKYLSPLLTVEAFRVVRC